MAEDMIGTLFESDATSILDSEASNLLTELESMATTDPGQPPPRQPPQQNPFYDYGGGGAVAAQPMQSPVSQAIQSPAGSLHSPGAMISPSTSHFGSPPPQQAGALQRQVSCFTYSFPHICILFFKTNRLLYLLLNVFLDVLISSISILSYTIYAAGNAISGYSRCAVESIRCPTRLPFSSSTAESTAARYSYLQHASTASTCSTR